MNGTYKSLTGKKNHKRDSLSKGQIENFFKGKTGFLKFVGLNRKERRL